MSEIEYTASRIMKEFSDDYGSEILSYIMEDVVKDVEECADKRWSKGDVKLAIARAILKRMEA